MCVFDKVGREMENNKTNNKEEKCPMAKEKHNQVNQKMCQKVFIEVFLYD